MVRFTTPSPRRDAYRARFLAVNTFIVDRLTEHKTRHAFSNYPQHIGSALDDWPESYQHIRSLIINVGKTLPAWSRDTLARACPNLTHLTIMNLPTYVPQTFNAATFRYVNRRASGCRRSGSYQGPRCGTSGKEGRPWCHPAELLGCGSVEEGLLNFLTYPSLRHIELQCENYYTTGTGDVSQVGWFNAIVAREICYRFAKVEREVRVEVVGKGHVFTSYFVPTEDGSWEVPERPSRVVAK